MALQTPAVGQLQDLSSHVPCKQAFNTVSCRAPHSRRRHRPVTARSNEIATVASATLTTSLSPATQQPDGTVLSSPTSSRNQALEPRLLRGREVEERALDCCIQMHQDHPNGLQMPSRFGTGGLDEAYDRCGIVTASYAKTFYLGTQLMTPEKAKAVWAVYVWCRRTDELVDGPNASRITPEALDRWEERLEGIFEGRPYDILDAALTDTVSKFPVHIQPFRDMIDGMRMDLVKQRYETFDELYEYCYRVAGTVGLMTTPIMGIDPSYKGPLRDVYQAALGLGTANQLTNILRDVGEDITERNRIYVPTQELKEFGIAESEVSIGMFAPSTGKIDDRWQRFMQFQIKRAREYFSQAESGVDFLDKNARWPVWSALILYRQILDGIENNGYNNFTKRSYVPKWKKLLSLPFAAVKARSAVNLKASNESS
ncbi:hypothetical protein WJX82_003734 [Trebouxia sp. C0006]